MSATLPTSLHPLILQSTGATAITDAELVQSLWSGYGQILRLTLRGSTHPTVILKHVTPPTETHHPRGWNSDLSHQRKLRSYQIETHFYQNQGSLCSEQCRIPKLLSSSQINGQHTLILEDLDHAGFPLRVQTPTPAQIHSCLSWLANFHAIFLHTPPTGLWPTGTYWHLDTRPDELAALDDLRLQSAAPLLDQKLREPPYQTLVHGDAKLANFCFSPTTHAVSAVDFQYTGGGCGIKDVAYFLGSCLSESELPSQAPLHLDHYFHQLKAALHRHHPTLDPAPLLADWRNLYPLAWADFHRFLKGWSPGHWKLTSYSEQLTTQALTQLLLP